MGEKTTSKNVKKFTQRTDAAQDALLRGSDLINRVKMNQERLIHFEYSEAGRRSASTFVFSMTGTARFHVFAAVRRIGQVSEI